MTHFVVLVLAVLIGIVAGLRTVTAPAVVAWAALLKWINMDGTWVSWLSHPVTVVVLSVLAVVEMIFDPLPSAPDRTAALQFGARLITGGFAGAVIGTAWGYPWSALGAGIIGAVLGTVGGLAARRGLTTANKGRGLPVALLEDAVAVLGGFGIAAVTAVL